MPTFASSISETRQTFRLALPMIAGQLGQMMMGWADTVMVGHLGVVPLAACAFGITVSHIFLICGFGLISSVSVCASRAFGAGRHRETGEFLVSGSVLALLAGLGMVGLVYLGLPWLYLLGQEPEVVREAQPFLLLMTWSIVPALLTTAAKDYSESLSRPWLPFWIIIGGVGLNVLLNWVFIHGRFGLPAMGLAGAGLGTLIARLAITATLYTTLARKESYRPYRAEALPWAVLVRQVRTLFRIGWPSALHLLGEVGLFASATFLMGAISITALAAHQVAITCAATAFMVPLGLAFAVTVRVGQAVGAGEEHRVRPIAFGALGLGVALMLGSGLLFLIFGGSIPGWFVEDAAVRELATRLLWIAAIFGIFDAAQVLCTGALRGLADVRVPMLFVYAAYWGVACPLAYVLALPAGWGGVGVWVGLATGLACAALALAGRLWVRSGRPVGPIAEPLG